MLLRSSGAARGLRPSVFGLNRGAPQALGLEAWWPMTGAHPLAEQTGRKVANSRDISLNFFATTGMKGAQLGGLALDVAGSATPTPSAFSGIPDGLLSPASYATNAGGFTWSCWAKPTSASPGSNTAFFGSWAGGVGWMLFCNGTSDIRVYGGGVQTTGVSSFSDPNHWYHLLGRVDYNVTTLTLFIDGRSVASVGGANNNSNSGVKIEWGNYADTAGAGLGAHATDSRFYRRPLSDTEIWQLYDPATRWDLYWTPSTRTHFFLNAAAGGGTQYTQSVSGTATTAGALLKQTSRALTGAVTSAGALVKQTNRALTGTLTTAGALAAIKIALKSLAGTLTTAGALVRQTQKPLAATLTTAGALVKETRRALTGALTTAGTLAAIKTALKSLTGTLTTAGALVRQAQLSKAGTLTTAGALTKSTAHFLTGTLTTAGTLTKLTARALSAVLSFLGTLVGVKQGAGTIPNIIRLSAVAFSAPSITSTAFSAPAISGVAWVDAD